MTSDPSETRAALNALLGALPVCSRRPCAGEGSIATYQDAEGHLVCGQCARSIPRASKRELAYRRLVRRLLGVLRGGRVEDDGDAITLRGPTAFERQSHQESDQ